MFRTISALVTCLSALLLLGVASTGALFVTTLPSGADVWIDGTYIGHSPLVLDALAPGRHAVSLTKTGWVPQDLDVTIVADGTALSSVQLQRAAARDIKAAPGRFAFKGVAVTAVMLDGLPVKPEKDGSYAAPTGTHRIEAHLASGIVTRTITVYPEMRTDVVIRDPESSEGRSPVVAPADDYLAAADMRIDGANVAIKHGGHDVAARLGSTSYRIDGKTVEFDAAPTLIGARLYLPLALLTQLTAAPKAK